MDTVDTLKALKKAEQQTQDALEAYHRAKEVWVKADRAAWAAFEVHAAVLKAQRRKGA